MLQMTHQSLPRSATLAEIIKAWKDEYLAFQIQERLPVTKKNLAWLKRQADELANSAQPFLRYFWEDNDSRTPEELNEFAQKLSPGWAHDSGRLVNIVRSACWGADPLLLTATIRHNWHGGKFGFQFLPDPARVCEDEYLAEVDELICLFDEALNGDPKRILTGADADFFDALPERFSIYRGTAGISTELAAAGVCWTTKREIAEWFAARTAERRHAPPMVLTARARKADVLLAKAVEFEVVTVPRRTRQLACRKVDKAKIEFEWKP